MLNDDMPPLRQAALDDDQESGVVDAMAEKAVQAGDVIIRWVSESALLVHNSTAQTVTEQCHPRMAILSLHAFEQSLGRAETGFQ